MTPEDLDLVVARAGHARLAAMASDSNPDPAARESARAAVAGLAALFRGASPPAAYPPLAAQARGLAGSLATWLRAGCPITPAAERARRRAICTGCPEFDPEARRCRVCGCFGAAKPWLGTATCPLGKWDRSDAPA